jgi:competence protein ComEA
VKPDLSSRVRLARSRARGRWYAWWYAPSTDAEGGISLRPRWDMHSALVICAVAMAGVALGCWIWWQARPHLVDVGGSVLAEGSPPPVPVPTPMPAPSAAPSSPTLLVIDVEGRVRRPGVVLVPAGARVEDALRAAGGPRPGMSTRSVNLARLLVDGEQVVLEPDQPVPTPTATPAVGGARMPRRAVPVGPSAASPVNLNTATSAVLQTLPGVGPVLASRILAWRAAHGRFSTIEELQEVSGIGPARFAELRALVRV